MNDRRKDYIPLHVQVLEITDEQRASARLVCASNSVDVIELEYFLNQLGLLDVR